MVVVAIAAFLVTGLVAPGFLNSTVFDNKAVQQGVEKILKDDYKLDNVSDVSCPSNKKVEVGSTFECTAKIDGDSKKIKITVKTEDGQYEVGQPD